MLVIGRKSVLVAMLGAALAAPIFAIAGEDTTARIERLERRIDYLSERSLEIDSLKREVRTLQGRLEEQQHELEELKSKQREQFMDLDSRIGAGSPANTAPDAGMDSAQPMAGNSATAANKPMSQADVAKAQKAYDQAYNLLRPEQRKYEEAIKAFEAFLRNYPSSELAVNAQYWLGEANYVTQKNDAALAAFTRLIEQYPESSKVAGALLKIGYILDASGKTAEAKKTLNRVVTEFSKTPEAGLAKQRLAGMR